jgi:hypothetical protein
MKLSISCAEGASASGGDFQLPIDDCNSKLET